MSSLNYIPTSLHVYKRYLVKLTLHMLDNFECVLSPADFFKINVKK